MAQELSEKIRAAAQSKGIDPELALSIARAESALNPAAKAKTSSAAGLFQVVDDTWKQYGGRPGKKLDADENIRVGTDIIADNAKYLQTVLGRAPKPAEVYAAHYFGPTKAKAVLAASPDTPIADILSAQVIKANPNLQGKTAGQVIAQLESKVGGAPAPAAAVSRETQTEAEKVMEPALRSGMTAKAPAQPSVPRETQLASLGPSYQAALALSFLADSDDDKREKDIDNEPSVAEKWLAQQPSRPAALDLAEVKIRSPFPTEQPQQPVMMAGGGDPVEEQESAPAREPVYFFKNASRMQDMGADVQGAMAGARVPLGEDSGLTLGANISKMTKDEKETMARAMLASLYSKVGEGELRANLIKPQGSGTEGVYMGDVGGSYPVGEGRLSASRTYMHTPYGSGPTGYQVGYGGKVGPGFLSANAMLPDRGSPQFQVRYQLPVGRAEGSPETGEEARKGGEPQVTGVNKALDFIAQRLDPKMFPTSARTLLETVQGTKTPITESHFSPEELDVMRQLATLKGGDKGTVNYGDYLALAQEMRKKGSMAASATPSMFSMADPFGNVQTTLGQFRYQRTPQGTLQIVDTYDFNPPNPNLMQEARTGDYGGFGPYGLIRDYAGEKIPPGRGREVRINLPPVKRADGSPEGGEQADLTRPATFNPNIARQGAAARRLAAMRDVNTLPDPRTYAAVSGFLGQAPDEMGFSALHPDISGIKRAGEAGFYAGTAAQVAPIAGTAAKMLGKLTGSALNERLLAGQSLIPGTNTPAPIAFAVKPRGGHFELAGQTYGAPGDFSKPIDSVQNYVNSHLAITNDHPLNEWLRSKVGSYIRRDMGTEMDQFVKAADEGKKLHFVSKPIGEDYTGPHIPGWLRQARKAEGFPEEGVAKTPYGQKVEMLTDRAVDPIMLEDAYPTTVPPGIKQFVETDPTMRMYGINSTQLEELQLPELRNKMAQMRQMPESLSFYGQPAVKVPERYMFTDQTLQGLTPAQASERVAQFDTWKQEAKQKMASRAAFDDPNISRSPAENGSVWLNPPDLEKNPAIRELIQDVGCDGGWCTNKESMALSNGSGNNRLTVLLDKNARPKAQMTITTIAPDTDDFLLSMNDIEAQAFKEAYPDVALYDARAIRNTPEYQAWSKINPDGMAITEVKGINNEVDLVNEPYIKQIQDRVKQLDAQFDLKSVDNLDGIGLTEISRDSPYDMLNHFSLPTMTRNSYGDSVGTRMLLKDKFGSEKEGLQAILDEALKLNGGSKYFSGNQDEISDLFHKATGNILGPTQRATGGLIERRLDDSRKYL